MRNGERDKWMELLESERAAHRAEIKDLLNRIQHPERLPVEPAERIEHDPPKDLAELAHVGQEVPTGIYVGDGNDGN